MMLLEAILICAVIGYILAKMFPNPTNEHPIDHDSASSHVQGEDK